VATYGALALGMFAWLGAPGGAAVTIAGGSVAQAAILMFFLAMASVIAETSGRGLLPRAAPRFAPTLEVAALAAMALVACIGGVIAASVPWGGDLSADLALAALPLAAALGFAAAVGRHGWAIHPAVIAASAAGLLFARVAFLRDEDRALATALVPI